VGRVCDTISPAHLTTGVRNASACRGLGLCAWYFALGASYFVLRTLSCPRTKLKVRSTKYKVPSTKYEVRSTKYKTQDQKPKTERLCFTYSSTGLTCRQPRDTKRRRRKLPCKIRAPASGRRAAHTPTPIHSAAPDTHLQYAQPRTVLS